MSWFLIYPFPHDESYLSFAIYDPWNLTNDTHVSSCACPVLVSAKVVLLSEVTEGRNSFLSSYGCEFSPLQSQDLKLARATEKLKV